MTVMTHNPRATPPPPARRTIRAPRGVQRTCKTWQAEAALRMLMNNLDPEVAEDPGRLIVYGGRGQAARSWEAFDAIVECLRNLEADETLLVQSGKPVGIVTTHEDAPRVLIANSNLVPHWATQSHFDDLCARGLMMFGQMTAGSWIYIGTQGIVQGTYETFAEAARQRFGGTLRGRLCLTAGCGGMGGAQPLAITMNEGVCLIADVDLSRLERRRKDRYLDEIVVAQAVAQASRLCLDEAIDRAVECARRGEAISIGVEENAADLYDALLERGITPDIVTDQTPAHDVFSYVPSGLTVEEAENLRRRDPRQYERFSVETMTRQVRAMVTFQQRGAVVFDYGNNIRQRAYDNGYSDAFAFPGFVPAFIRPQFCRGRGPFRWVALSGDPEDIRVTDEALLELFPLDGSMGFQPVRNEGASTSPGSSVSSSSEDHASLHRWIRMAQQRIAFQGLPARICWLGLGERDKAGLLFNDLVRDGKVKAPIVIGRDHLDCGSVASPNRETEGMKDGTDAVSDWPLLNAMVNVASGASWVSFHHGGGVGIGFSQHAGQVIVADGTEAAAKRLQRVLTNDPLLGVLRHADAGYDEAVRCAVLEGVRVPMG